ncbi:MAG: serine hydrolase [Sedimentibacter sp.]|jgi:bla regulator protein BlaR1|nr:serine hydrolase [Sedimentibacter sp.]
MKLFNNKRKHSCLHKAAVLNKSIFSILAILLCISFIGCNKANENNNKKPENINTATVSPASVADQDTTIGKYATSNEVQVTEKAPEVKDVDYSDCFNGIEGCAVFFNSNTNTYMMYNKKLCEKRTSPCSTFKIIATIMGLDKGIITSVDTTMGYDGTIYSTEKWNKNLSLKDAFKESCVWYFRKVIDKVGQSNVQSYLDKLKYGNCDISEWDGSGINSLPELNGFWLESSLEISPKEQVNILASLFSGKTDCSEQNINILKEVMLTQKIGSVSVYGKTGTGQNYKTKHRDNGWFVGMFENSDESYYFAVHLNDDSKEVSGPMAKEIALDIINQYYTESN